ncbi:unnamed protein product [Gongylonema pulchrum]|uniref:Suppressor protein SRP40-like n=1 Tax=Gongylonema pulchrum TaxID=637853 RepID=A0A183EKE6_9BILA|nr:unnamed protein product [Gongylonema pulchrum]
MVLQSRDIVIEMEEEASESPSAASSSSSGSKAGASQKHSANALNRKNKKEPEQKSEESMSVENLRTAESLHETSLEYQQPVDRTYSINRQTPSYSTYVVSDEDVARERAQPYADSIHSSDFEIPSFLNSVPAPSQRDFVPEKYCCKVCFSDESVCQSSKTWIISKGTRTAAGAHAEDKTLTKTKAGTRATRNVGKKQSKGTRRKPALAQLHNEGRAQMRAESGKDAQMSGTKKVESRKPADWKAEKHSGFERPKPSKLSGKNQQKKAEATSRFDEATSRFADPRLIMQQQKTSSAAAAAAKGTAPGGSKYGKPDYPNVRNLKMNETMCSTSADEMLKMNIKLVPKKGAPKNERSNKGSSYPRTKSGSSRSPSFE